MIHAYYSDHFVLPLPEGHRFPMQKYALVRRYAVERSVLHIDHLHVPDAATDAELLRVHTRDYLDRVKHGTLTVREIRRIGFPWSPGLVERSRRSVGGTICACRAAISGPEGIAANLAGGTHHAHPDFGAGFCVFNDVAVAARAMQAEGRVRRVAILDCDVHQGDGTAAIFAEDDSIFTFSIHGEKNFPFRKQQSDLDIGLEDGAEDEVYLDALRHGVTLTLDLAEPELVIYLAGADPYHGDRLGRLSVSMAGLAERDRFVLASCRERGIPTAIVMSGGYAPDLNDIAAIHVQTLEIASEVVTKSGGR